MTWSDNCAIASSFILSRFLRFHPDCKMMEFGLTPVETLEKHHAIAKEQGLKYEYLGNVPGHALEHTYLLS